MFGPYYYFHNFKSSVRYAGWSSNYEKRQVFNKQIADENGLYYQGGFVRFALFLQNYRVVLDRKTDPMMKYVEAYDNTTLPPKSFLDKIKKGNRGGQHFHPTGKLVSFDEKLKLFGQ